MSSSGTSRGWTLRVGIDLGGTKIAGIVLAGDARILVRQRVPTPRDDYEATLAAIRKMVRNLLRVSVRKFNAMGRDVEQMSFTPVGIGMPGSLNPVSGLVQNANSTWLNGMPFLRDLRDVIGRPVRLANDANCFAISEAIDGAGAREGVTFGVILGTGCGGGVVVDGELRDGPLGVTGEWGHTPLPHPNAEEYPGPSCWCGRRGCMETWVSGPALARDHRDITDETLRAEDVVSAAMMGDAAASATFARFVDRLGRGLATVVNIVDPDVIVLGGGLSDVSALYERLPDAIAPHVFADHVAINIRKPRWGAMSGVRGAARLWSIEDVRALWV
ncbi:MAG: ROK family protein [Pseudomonadota bacterium]